MQTTQAVTNNPVSLQSNPFSGQLTLSKFDFPTFKSANYHAWSHIARIFFVQHSLFDIINGNETNPAASNILFKVLDGIIQLINRSTLQSDLTPT